MQAVLAGNESKRDRLVSELTFIRLVQRRPAEFIAEDYADFSSRSAELLELMIATGLNDGQMRKLTAKQAAYRSDYADKRFKTVVPDLIEARAR